MENTDHCKWIGDEEGCCNLAILGKSYCPTHHNRMYIVLLPEMADYILNKSIAED